MDTLDVVSTAPPLPFQLDEEGVDETLRLRYRWLDLRRDKLQRNIGLRAQMVSIIRRVMEEAGFLDIQTPILFKPTPEGARDFIVPSRLQPGRFYALPQSPQILKQLLVIGGFDRYYQIAICFRDEDLRADRVQEITQLDVEMAFPDQEFIIDLMERMIAARVAGVHRRRARRAVPHGCRTRTRCCATAPTSPISASGSRSRTPPRSRAARSSSVFAGAPCRALPARAAGVLTRRARAAGGAGEGVGRERARLPRLGDERRGALADRKVPLRGRARRFPIRAGHDAALRVRTTPAVVARVLGSLRLHLGRELGLVDEDALRLGLDHRLPDVRVVGGGRALAGAHHPFTRPAPGWEDRFDEEPAAARAHQYDLVGNGNELGGGSFRIHEPELQERVFRTIALTPEEQRAKFGFLLDALAMGAPPHGGIAFGIDRMLMVLAQEPNLRDTIAFPKNQAGVDPMSGAPSDVPAEQLAELGIRTSSTAASNERASAFASPRRLRSSGCSRSPSGWPSWRRRGSSP